MNSMVIVLAVETSAGSGMDWIWPLLLGAAITLVAGVIGKAFEARSSRNAWLRDQRLRVYSTFNSQVHAAGKLAGDLAKLAADAHHDDPDSDLSLPERETSREFNAAVALVNSTCEEVNLLAGKDVRPIAEEICDRLGTVSATFHDREWLGSRPRDQSIEAFEEHPSLVELNEAIERFVGAARQEVVGT